MQDQFNTQDAALSALSETSPYGEVWEDDPRFAPAEDDSASRDEARHQRRMSDQRRRRSTSEARDRRDRLVADLSPLADLGINPAGPPMSLPEAALLLGMTYKRVHEAVSRNRDEISNGDAVTNLLDVTALARLALLTRHSTSPMVGRIHRALDPDSARPILRFADPDDGPTPTHRASVEAAHDEAYEVIEAVRDQDPAAVWERVRGMAPEEAAAVIVVLAALVPDNQRGLLNWVKGLSPDGSSASGLARLIPTPQTAADGRSLSTTITDSEIGL